MEKIVKFKDRYIIASLDNKFYFYCTVCKKYSKHNWVITDNEFLVHFNGKFYTHMCKECMELLEKDSNEFIFKYQLGIL